MGLLSYCLPDPWASTPSLPRRLRMDQLAGLPTESIVAVGSTLGPGYPYLYRHVCRTQTVIISADTPFSLGVYGQRGTEGGEGRRRRRERRGVVGGGKRIKEEEEKDEKVQGLHDYRRENTRTRNRKLFKVMARMSPRLVTE